MAPCLVDGPPGLVFDVCEAVDDEGVHLDIVWSGELGFDGGDTGSEQATPLFDAGGGRGSLLAKLAGFFASPGNVFSAPVECLPCLVALRLFSFEIGDAVLELRQTLIAECACLMKGPVALFEPRDLVFGGRGAPTEDNERFGGPGEPALDRLEGLGCLPLGVVGVLELALGRGCLLYTSPSPRDED